MYILIDVGGTRMRISSSFDGKNLQEVENLSTPEDFDQALKIIKDFLLKEDSTSTDNVLCCGLPGVLDKEKSVLLSAPNLPNWINIPIKGELENNLNLKVYLENDTALAGLGEAIKGSGAGYSIVAYLAFGTGIGGARIVDTKIDRSYLGFEPGHQILDLDGTVTGHVTDWEGLVGGKGLESRFGKRPEDIDDKKVWQEVGKIIAAGVVNTILYWSPEIVVLGGSLIKNKYLSQDGIKKQISEMLKVFPSVPEIKMGSLGDSAALYGGLKYIQQE